MIQPDAPFGPLRRRDGEPAFDEQWQAQVLGMADILVSSGVIAADNWANALGAALVARNAEKTEDTTETYYEAVLDALQTLLAAEGQASATEIETREEQWRQAYLNTPHGQPVEIQAPPSKGHQ